MGAEHVPHSMDFLASSAPGCLLQTLFIHRLSPTSYIHPLGWQCSITPVGNFSPLGRVLPLNIIIGASLVPSAKQHKTVNKLLSSHYLPVWRTNTVILPIALTVFPSSMSENMWVSSMFPIEESGKLCSCLCRITYLWKSPTLPSKSDWSFWEIFVLVLSDKPLPLINSSPQPLEALNSPGTMLKPGCFARAFAVRELTMFSMLTGSQ